MSGCDIEAVLDRDAEGTPYEALAEGFLTLERSGEDSVCLLAEAAAATTGRGSVTQLRERVEAFHAAFIKTGRVSSFRELAALDLEDEGLCAVFSAERNRHVLLEAAAVFATTGTETTDLETLRLWAAQADIYRYKTDPIGAIAGVGPGSFQFLRMLAGVDTVKPDPALESFLRSLKRECPESPIDPRGPLRTVASCEWIGAVSSYRPIEIDQLAWWLAAEPDQRAAVVLD